MHRMPGVRTYVENRVPIPVLSEDDVDRPPTVAEPDVGARWGRPSAFNFTLAAEEDVDIVTAPSATVADFNELVLRDGTGVQQATDHNSNVIAESLPAEPVDQVNPQQMTYFGYNILFYCGEKTTESEEVESLPNNVESVTPVITRTRTYVRWDFLDALTHYYSVHDYYSRFRGGVLPFDLLYGDGSLDESFD